MSATILLITALDETHRRPLLESQGYSVQVASPPEASKFLNATRYDLALIPTENGVAATLEYCAQMKRILPELRVAIIAQRAEYVPPGDSADAIIREQHSPARFLAAVKRLLETSAMDGKSFSASENQ